MRALIIALLLAVAVPLSAQTVIVVDGKHSDGDRSLRATNIPQGAKFAVIVFTPGKGKAGILTGVEQLSADFEISRHGGLGGTWEPLGGDQFASDKQPVDIVLTIPEVTTAGKLIRGIVRIQGEWSGKVHLEFE